MERNIPTIFLILIIPPKWMKQSLHIQDLFLITGKNSRCSLGLFLYRSNNHLLGYLLYFYFIYNYLYDYIYFTLLDLLSCLLIFLSCLIICFVLYIHLLYLLLFIFIVISLITLSGFMKGEEHHQNYTKQKFDYGKNEWNE